MNKTEVIDNIELENLHSISGLSDGWSSLLCEAAVMHLSSDYRKPGLPMPVTGHFERSPSIWWNIEIKPAMNSSWKDTDEMTEFAACGIAIMLMSTYTKLHYFERSAKGTGFDYHVKEHDDDQLFQNASRLEVSGIGCGTLEDVNRRCDIKVKQVLSKQEHNDRPAYIIVVEFGTPMSKVEYKDGSS